MEAEDILIRLFIDKNITKKEFKFLMEELNHPKLELVHNHWEYNDPNNPHIQLLNERNN